MEKLRNQSRLRCLWVVALMWLAPMVLSAKGHILTDTFDINHLIVYIMAAFLIGMFILFFYNRLYIYRERDANIVNQSQNSRLALVLQSANLRLWLYDVETRHYFTLSEVGERSDEYNPVEFSRFFDRDNFETMRQYIFDICEGRRTTADVTMLSVPAKDGSVSHYDINISVAEQGKDGRPKTLLGIQHDVTTDLQRQKKVKQLLLRYHTVFNSSLVDMLYYDSNGVLRDINEKACQTFGVKNRDMVISGDFLLKNNPMFHHIELENLQDTYSSSIVNFSQFSAPIYRLAEFGLGGKMYYESTINSIRDKEGRLEGFYMAGRNITEMVDSYHRQQEGMLKLRRATKDIEDYVKNINYALRVSGVRLVSYYPATYTLEISDNINKSQMRLSQLRCIRLATPRYRRYVSSALNRMDHLTERPFTQLIETEIRDQKRRQIWLQFNMVPMKDSEGRIVRYFGMFRNLTDLVETEQRLAEETKKAQETELLKQSFLANMSYEIRTPLNTVVGFAELFETEHDPADEAIFVEEIKRNSNSLLRLVNDILFLSRLDANMIECTMMEIDFALVFESHCQIGWSSVSPTVKTIVENPYEHLVVTIDYEHLGHVIEKLCQNAVHFTQEGTIRAKYEYRHDELTISIEDTGRGIDEQTLPHIFDRFARNAHEELLGTGLDLPIVKSLVEQMGGNIEFQSELGKGTTAWVTIPCEAKTLEMRRDIIVQS